MVDHWHLLLPLLILDSFLEFPRHVVNVRLDFLLVQLLVLLASDVWLSGIAIVGVDNYLAVHFKGVSDGFESLQTVQKCPLVITWFVLFKFGVTSLLRALHEIVVALKELFGQFLEILFAF